MARHGLVKQIVGSAGGGDVFFTDSSPFAKLLDLCVKFRSSRDARSVHGRIIQTPFCKEVFIQNRLVDVYGKCGYLDYARKLFDRMSERNVYSYNSIISTLMRWSFVDEGAWLFSLMPEKDQCSWNSMIAGFAQHDRFEEALDCFVRMHKDDFVLNDYSFGSGLSACSRLKDLKLGAQIHGLISKSKYSLDVFMGSGLIDFYSKCGLVGCARRVFDGMEEKNVVSWNCLITCYEQNGPANEALEAFRRMIEHGSAPDEVTLASVASACATLAAFKEGVQIHARVMKSEKFRNDLILGNALVDMYAKCGRVNEARCVFDRMPVRNAVSETTMVSGYAKSASVNAARSMFATIKQKDIVSWNALIAGYTQNGENEEALGLFRMLKRESVCPTHYTFGNLLNACANLADLELGRQAHSHVVKHGSRFQFGEEPDIFVGNSLIDMYMKWKYVAEKIFEIDPTSSGPYVLLANMYSELGRWGDASNVHVFMVKDKRHPQKKEIYSILKLLTKQMRQAGYVPDASDHEAYEEPSELESSSCSHMEMQAEVAVM
ncbi:hypothetical protein OIU77_002791 [Salix suchowensis]|uniref:Pentatricopeptide repeat-containing protein n=1 Tax=Salix suchowensis TaxID=1278906 RepID=A0ABQ9B0B8_9ROSI|nr:hypothetical protein OIU77_002791 [Salix suchowensis]